MSKILTLGRLDRHRSIFANQKWLHEKLRRRNRIRSSIRKVQPWKRSKTWKLNWKKQWKMCFFNTFWKYLPFDQTEKSMETVWSHSFSKFVAQDADRFLWIASSSMAAWSFIGHLKKFLKGLKIFFFEIFWNGILLPKLFWPTVRKNCSSDREKLLKFEAEGREFQKFFSLTRTIFTHSRSEQFW